MTTVLIILLILHILAIIKVLQVRWQMGTLVPDEPIERDQELPLLSVILPVRNEETNAEGALSGLMAQDHPNLEIIVVNDGSTDGTGEILQRLASESDRVTVIDDAGELPEGWRGKNYALWQGYQAAKGEHLLLIDADVRVEPTALRLAARTLRDRGAGLLTVLPRLVTGALWEHVIQNAVGQMFITFLPINEVEDPKNTKMALANGPFILLTQEAYDAIGGHDALKGEIAEDFVMAHRLKAAGYGIAYLDGTRVVSLRMYETFRGLWEGWSKNFYFACMQSIPVAAAYIAFIAFYFIFPYVWLPVEVGNWLGATVSGVGGVAFPGWRLVLLVAILGCQQIVRRLFALFYRVDPRNQSLEPFGFLMVIALIVNSFIRYRVTKNVTWRGRSHNVEA